MSVAKSVAIFRALPKWRPRIVRGVDADAHEPAFEALATLKLPTIPSRPRE